MNIGRVPAASRTTMTKKAVNSHACKAEFWRSLGLCVFSGCTSCLRNTVWCARQRTAYQQRVRMRCGRGWQHFRKYRFHLFEGKIPGPIAFDEIGKSAGVFIKDVAILKQTQGKWKLLQSFLHLAGAIADRAEFRVKWPNRENCVFHRGLSRNWRGKAASWSRLKIAIITIKMNQAAPPIIGEIFVVKTKKIASTIPSAKERKV